MVNLNEKHLGISEIQWDWDRCHDWLVYGYDDFMNEFYCCGYINKKGIGEYYGTIKVKYYNLITSIKKFLNHSHDLDLVNYKITH